MKSIFMLILCSCCILQAGNAQTQTAVYLGQEIPGSGSKGFYRYLPADYNTSGKNYPVIIWIHGYGQIGQGNATDLPKVLEWGLPKIISEGGFPSSFTVNSLQHSFIVISPQFMGWPSGNNLNGMVNYVLANYRVDLDRVYLLGISAGGAAVWDYTGASRTNSDKIAAIIPFCGASEPTQARANNLAASRLPVWAFHNTHDGTVPVAYSRNWVNYINSYVPAVSPAAKLTEFPVQSNNAVIAHECWSLATLPSYKPQGINIYEWLLQYKKRTASPGNVLPVARAGNDVSITLPANVNLNGSASSDADGTISAYRWRKLSGPVTHSFADSTKAATTVSNLSGGTYLFELRVTDNAGGTATDNISVTVQAASAPNQSPVANAGNNSSIQLPVNQVLLNGCNSSDPEGSSLQFKWRKLSGPANFQIMNDAVCQADIRGLTEGTYRFELKVTDAGNLTATDLVDVIVLPATTQAEGEGKTLRVNVFGGSNPYNNAQWNNWNVVNAASSSSFNYDDGTPSTINAVLSAYGLMADNGAAYASNATSCPQAIMRYTSANTSYRTLILKGMSNSRTYNLEMYAGRANTGNKTVMQIGNRSDTISTDNNSNDVAKFINIAPDNNGRITVTISRIGTWNYLSGFTITENNEGSSARSSSQPANEPLVENKEIGSSEFNVYPNPVNDIIYLRIPASVSGNYKMTIMNTNGKIMLQKTGTKGNAAYEQKIDATTLPRGIYLLTLFAQNETRSIRVIKL